MHETFQWSLYSNLLKRFSGLYMGTNTYVSEYMLAPLDRALGPFFADRLLDTASGQAETTVPD